MDIERISEEIVSELQSRHIYLGCTCWMKEDIHALIQNMDGKKAFHGWRMFLALLLRSFPVCNKGTLQRYDNAEHEKIIKIIWNKFFQEDPEASFSEIRHLANCWTFSPKEAQQEGESEATLHDFREEEKEMHKVPWVFELLDYFMEKTSYEYNESFQTFCCHFMNTPYFHFAMDPLLPFVDLGDGIDIEMLLYFDNDCRIRIHGLDKISTFELAASEIGIRFFQTRYPRFFWPESSLEQKNAFISEGERKLAYLFQKHILKNNPGHYDKFKKKTKVIYQPLDLESLPRTKLS